MSEGAHWKQGGHKKVCKSKHPPMEEIEMGGQMSSADDPERGDRLELDGQDGHHGRVVAGRLRAVICRGLAAADAEDLCLHQNSFVRYHPLLSVVDLDSNGPLLAKVPE